MRSLQMSSKWVLLIHSKVYLWDYRPIILEVDEESKKKKPLKRLYDTTYWVWIVVIIYSLVVQSLRTADLDLESSRGNFISK